MYETMTDTEKQVAYLGTMAELAEQICLRFGKVDIEDMLEHPELYGDCAWELQAHALRLARMVLRLNTDCMICREKQDV